MVRERARVILRLRSLFREQGIPVVTPRSAPQRVPLHRLRDSAAKYVGRAYLRQLETITDLMNEARIQLLELARTFPAFELLQTVPHVGEIRSAQLIAIVGHPDRFKSRRRFWSYGALGLIERTSAEHRISNGEVVRDERFRGLRLSKSGQPLLKKILRDMALYASVGRGSFREVYDAHIARGLKPSIARLSLARKIAAVIRAVWRSGKPFDPCLVRG
jgi:transposase